MTVRRHQVRLMLGLFIVVISTGCAQWHLAREPWYRQVAILKDRGLTAYEKGEYHSALEQFEKALAIVNTEKDPAVAASIQYRIGQVNARLERYEEALAAFQLSLAALQRADGLETSLEVAIVNNEIGNMYQTLGRPRTARHYYETALTYGKGNTLGEARTLANLASTYLEEARYGKALALSEQARGELDRQPASANRDLADILTNVGSLYSALGDQERARRFHYQAERIYRLLGDRRGVAAVRHNIGVANLRTGDSSGAVREFEKSLAIRPNNDRLDRARTLNSFGMALIAVGRSHEALQVLGEALTTFKAFGSLRYEAAVLDSIGTAHAHRHDFNAAFTSFHRSLAIWLQVGDREGERVTMTNLGLLCRDSGQFAIAVFYLKQAVTISQAQRVESNTLERDLRDSLARRLENPYHALAELLIQQGRLLEAEQVLGMLKEHEYHEFLRGDEAKLATASSGMTAYERELERGLREISQALSRVHAEREQLRRRRVLSADDLERMTRLNEEASMEYSRVLQHLESIQKTVISEDPQERGITKALEIAKSRGATSQLLADLANDSGARPVLLYFVPSSNATTFLIVTPSGVLARHSGVGARELNGHIVELREAIARRDTSYRPIAERLYDALIAPIEDDLKSAAANVLMLYLTDSLRYLPFAALFDRRTNSHLISKYGLAVYTHVAQANLRDQPVTRWSAIAFGTTQQIGRYGALPAVREEIARIVRDPRDHKPQGVLSGQRHLDEEFSRRAFEQVLSAEGGFPVLHIATHFDLSPGSDDDSVLVLGDGERMTLKDIRNRAEMRAYELVTLSACDTGIGGSFQVTDGVNIGAEVEGLGATLQQQGARAVLATLWKVQDGGTSQLMHAYYHARGEDRKATKVKALQEAQLKMLDGTIRADDQKVDLRMPYYWAPFVLMGNWR